MIWGMRPMMLDGQRGRPGNIEGVLRDRLWTGDVNVLPGSETTAGPTAPLDSFSIHGYIAK
jgi:hypothetical protein